MKRIFEYNTVQDGYVIYRDNKIVTGCEVEGLLNIQSNQIALLKDLLLEVVDELSIYDDARVDFRSKYLVLRKAKQVLGDRFPSSIYIGEDEDFPEISKTAFGGTAWEVESPGTETSDRFNSVVTFLAIKTGVGQRYRYILGRRGICPDKPIELIYSDDDMQTWNLVEVGKKGQHIPATDCLIEFNNRLYLAASNGFIFVSEDKGLSFAPVEVGCITNENYCYINGAGEYLLAYSPHYVAVSRDEGRTWAALVPSTINKSKKIQQPTASDFGGIFPNLYRRSRRKQTMATRRIETKGICQKCNKPFIKAIGLDSPARWNVWATGTKQMTPLQKWWNENAGLCGDCEKPFEKGEQ